MPAADKAAWVDGFFADGAHTADSRCGNCAVLLDHWVCQLEGRRIRRPFCPYCGGHIGTFAAAERQAIAQRIAVGTQNSPVATSPEHLDVELAGAGPGYRRSDLGLASRD
jgi:hypothetical protein